MGFIGSSLCLRGHYWRGYAHKSLKVASMPDDCNGIRLDNPHSWHIKGWRWNGRTEWDKMGGRHWMNGQRVLFIKDKCIWMRCVCFCSLKGLCYITEIKTELWTHCSCDSSCPNAVSVSFLFFFTKIEPSEHASRYLFMFTLFLYFLFWKVSIKWTKM